MLELMQNILPLILYTAGIVLVIVLIVMFIKLIKTIEKLNIVIDDVDKKINSLNGVFSVIDFCTDKVSSITGKVVDKITKWVIKFNKKKYNLKKEDENYE